MLAPSFMLSIISRYAWSVENRPRTVAARKTQRTGGVHALSIKSHYPASEGIRQELNPHTETLVPVAGRPESSVGHADVGVRHAGKNFVPKVLSMPLLGGHHN
jgi:hypothetical protein